MYLYWVPFLIGQWGDIPLHPFFILSGSGKGMGMRAKIPKAFEVDVLASTAEKNNKQQSSDVSTDLDKQKFPA